MQGYPHAGSHTEESCTTYNALKVSRHLFGWTAAAPLADYYERTLLNVRTAPPPHFLLPPA